MLKSDMANTVGKRHSYSLAQETSVLLACFTHLLHALMLFTLPLYPIGNGRHTATTKHFRSTCPVEFIDPEADRTQL